MTRVDDEVPLARVTVQVREDVSVVLTEAVVEDDFLAVSEGEVVALAVVG